MGVKHYLLMMRPANSALSGFGAAFAVLAYTGYSPRSLLLPTCAFATGFLLTASSMLVNDVVDVEVDRVNKPWKPLPSGKASPRAALALAAAFFLAGVLSGLPAGWPAVLVALAYGLLGVSYSYARKHWLSSTMVAASTTGPVVYGYVVAGLPAGLEAFTIVFAATMFLVTLGREYLKSVQDYEGDLKQGYKTIATVFGVEAAYKAMLAVGAGGAALGLSTLLLPGLSHAYKALIVLAAAAYLLSITRAYKERTSRALEKSRRATLAAMAIGMAAFWLSRWGV
ncbi:MAG: UbiA family prenyltransferase [Desulfurococcaceae archaeon]